MVTSASLGEGNPTDVSVASDSGLAHLTRRISFPNADQVESVLVKRAVMPQLARRAATIHDDSMRLVVGPSQPINIARESRDQHNSHTRLPLLCRDGRASIRSA
jgi:hypothetical protein